jgi:tetratricopeptide (TPR) repeat protein
MRLLGSIKVIIKKNINRFRGWSRSEKIAFFTVIISLLSLSVLVVSLITPKPDPTFYEYRIQGDKFLNQGEYMTAICAYDKALELQDSVIVWKNQGIAYMDWAINNQTIAIEVGERPLYSYTRQLIEHYSSTNSLLVDTNLMQSSYECFCKAIIYSPKDPELLIYKAIASLYTFNFSASDPISTFNDTITYIKALHSDKLTVPQLSILKDATYGLGMAYLEMDLDTEANRCFTALEDLR